MADRASYGYKVMQAKSVAVGAPEGLLHYLSLLQTFCVGESPETVFAECMRTVACSQWVLEDHVAAAASMLLVVHSNWCGLLSTLTNSQNCGNKGEGNKFRHQYHGQYLKGANKFFDHELRLIYKKFNSVKQIPE